MSDLKERAAFTLSASVKEELESAVPKSKRSRFVERAIARALLNEAKRKALDAIKNAPCADTRGEDSVEVLSRIRRERTADIVTRHQG